MLAAVIGALSILGEDWYWDDSHGGVSAADAAEASREMVYALEECLQPMEIVAARFYKTAAQNFTTGVTSVIDYEQEDIDTHNAVTIGSAWHFTVPTGLGGVYQVSARLRLAAAAGFAVTESLQLYLYLNTALVRVLEVSPGNTVNSVMGFGSTLITLAPGDVIDIRASQNSGGTIANVTGASNNEVTILRVSE